MIVHESRLGELYELVEPLYEHKVTIYADGSAYQLLDGKYPEVLLRPATAESFGTEFMDYKMAIRTVASLEEAIEHIALYGSGHIEAFITQRGNRSPLPTSRRCSLCLLERPHLVY